MNTTDTGHEKPDQQPAPRRRRAYPTRLLRVTTITVAVLLASGVVLQRSQSAFKSTTENDKNVLATQSVKLEDNDNGNAMFHIESMMPGQTASRCIQVTYQGDPEAAGEVKMFASFTRKEGEPSGQSNLAQFLDMTVTRGAAESKCSDQNPASPSNSIVAGPGGESSPIFGGDEVKTLLEFTGEHGNYDLGLVGEDSWIPAAKNEMRPYLITLTLKNDDKSIVASQGKKAEPVFFWEVRSP